MKCAICGVEVLSVEQAIEDGWTPYFYMDEEENGPACPNCTEFYLQVGEDGEMEVKSEYVSLLPVVH